MTAAFVAVRRFVAAALLRGALAVALVGGSFLVGAGNLASAQQTPSCCRSTGPGAVTAADNGSTSTDGRIRADYTRIQYQSGPFGGANWVTGDVRRTDGGNVIASGSPRTSKDFGDNTASDAAQGGRLIASGLVVPQEYIAAVWANYPGNTAAGGNGFVVRDVAIIYFGTIPTPATPVSLAVGVAPQRVTVNWNRVTYAERLSVVVATHDHAVTVTNIANGALSGNNIAPTRRSHVVSGLSDSRTYTVRARSVGPGGASGEALATITTPMGLQAPEAPVLAVAVTPDRIANPKATLSWTVEDNGTAITAFVLSYGTTQITITDGSATSYTIDLAYNTSYAFTLQALNAGGSSQAAATAVSVASGQPFQPAFGAHSTTPHGVSPAQVTISWTTPADGGSPITAFVLQHWEKHHANPSNSHDLVGRYTMAASQTMSVFSVKFGYDNRFFVAARNTHGNSNNGVRTNIQINDAPDAPTLTVAATPNGVAPAKVTLSWGAPDSNGSAITAYILSGSESATLPASANQTVISISLGVQYHFTLLAANAVGNSPADSAAVSVAALAPGAPAVVASPTPHGVTPPTLTISWTAPASNGGSAITGYWLLYGAQTVSLLANISEHVVTAPHFLLDTALTFSVAAINAIGTSAYTAGSALATSTPPFAATTFAASTTPDGETPAQITLSWSAPANGGKNINGYILSYGTVSANLPTSQTASVVNASLGVEYRFTLRAQNEKGAGAPATLAASVVALAPAAPSVRLFPTPNGVQPERLTIRISANADGGSPVTHFRIRYGIYNQSIAVVDGQATHIIADTDIFYMDYDFVFRMGAVNAVGTTFATLTARVSSTAPHMPQNFRFRTYGSTISLNWTPISNEYTNGSGGELITAYILTYRNVSTNFANNIGMAVIAGTVGQPYGFTLRAANVNGIGPAAEIPVFTVGQEPPARPVSLGLRIAPAAEGKLTLSGQDAALQWHVAPNTPSVSVYIVSFNGNSPATVAFVSATIQQHNLGANSIARGATVAFSVLARNQYGNSPSPAVLHVTVESTNPATVRNLAVNANVARVVATWSAPAHWGGGLPASANRYAYGFVGGVSGNVPNNDTALTLTEIVAGEAIAANTGYTVSIYATNAEGKSGMAVAVTFSTPQSPDAPGGVVAMGGNGRIAFEWSAPANLYGQPFSHYEYALLNASNTTLAMGSVTARAATVGGGTLANGSDYVFIVRAHSQTDYGDYATLTAAPIAPPTAPALVGTVSDAANDVYIMGGGFSWTAPAGVTGYVVQGDGGDKNLAATATAYALAQYANGQPHTLALLSYNAGLDPSTATITLTPFSRPGMPHNFAIAANPAQPNDVSLSWSAPANNGGFAVARYSIVAGDFSAGSLTLPQVVVTGVALGATVTVSAYALSDTGGGVFAKSAPATYTFIGGQFPPDTPTIAAAKGDKRATLSWAAPDNQGSAITEYIVYINGAALATLNATAAAYTATGLTNGVTYTFAVAAVNSIGESAQGMATATPQGVPTAPAGFNAAAGNGQATLTWQAASAEGSPINAYIVYVNNVASATLAAAARGYTATALNIGTNYNFAVAAANSLGVGARANANAQTPNTPTAPANLRADAGNATVSLFWSAASPRGGNVTAYIVFRNGSPIATLAASARSYAATGLTNGTVYMFGVAAQNAVGTGAIAQVSATPEAATEEEKVKEVDKAIAPAVVAAVTRQQTKALNNRIGALISGINVGGGGAGGGNVGGGSSFSMLGATFNKGNLGGGIAQALKQHGGALANGENLDPSVARSGSFALNAGAGNGAGGGGNFGIWGGADYAKIKDDKGDNTLDGHNASFFGGLDTAIASNVVVGVMFFHNRLKTDFASRNARGAQINGEYRLQANGVNPYILWRGANASAWGGFGVGKGERTQEQPQEDINRTDDVDMYSGVFGFRFALLRQDNGFALDAQTDLSRAHTDIAGTKFKSLNLRAMLEARRDIAVIGGGEFSPFVQAAMLRQKDDNESVEGWEAAGGARWNKGASWSGELRGRIARLSNGNQEVGGSGLLRHNVAGNKGLMLSLQPTYGDAGEFSGGDNILTQTTQSAESKPAAQLRADVAYGITGANAHWQPYIGATAGNNAEYRAGVSWQNALLRNSNMRAAIEAKREKQKTGLRFGFSANF